MNTLEEFLKPIPRDYQVDAADSYLDGPYPRALIQLPTGCGKTLTAATIFDRFTGRCLFLAHTDELVRQTCRAMLRTGLWPRVEKADEYRGGHYVPDMRERRKLFGGNFPSNDWFIFDKVVISSMQTFVTRMDKYAHDDMRFDLLCIDEAHRSRCRTYESIADRLTRFNANMRLLGLTATPYRADKKNLGKMFPEFAYRMTILDAIDRGWLVDVRGVTVEMKADTSKWVVGATKHGRDLTDSSLRASMASDECIESIAHPILEKGEGRKGIVFLPGIEASEAVAAALNALKPGYATFVHGKVPKNERRRRVRAFEDGEYTVMTGCQVFQEGFDVPDVSLVVMARPTQSRGLVEQQMGRGLRPLAVCIAGKHRPEERRAALLASAKPDCIAEGQRVLTDCGLVPIERLTIDMKVWDGLEFVRHCGTVLRGTRSVIEYAGLTATEDHNVWTKEGWKSFGECARRGLEIAITGDGGSGIRRSEGRYRRGDSYRAAEGEGAFSRVPDVWRADDQAPVQPACRNGWLSKVRQSRQRPAVVAYAGHLSEAALHQQERFGLEPLRRSGDLFQVRFAGGDGRLGARELGAQEGHGTRPHQQRRALRAGQPAIFQPRSEYVEHAEAADQCCHARLPSRPPGGSLRGRDAEEVAPGRPVMGTGSRPLLAEVRQAERRVWDILNAGPRHRFTAEGLLVHNCLVMDFVNNTKFKLVGAADVLLTDDDPKKAEYVRKQFKDRDPADRRAIREQLGDLDVLFNLNEALRTKGGPPPRQDYTVRDVNLYGAGATTSKKVPNPAARPSSSLLADAGQFFIKNPESMTAGQLAEAIEQRKLKDVGKRNYGWLLAHGVTKDQIKTLKLNWHDARYLRAMAAKRPAGDIPANWHDLVMKHRNGKKE